MHILSSQPHLSPLQYGCTVGTIGRYKLWRGIMGCLGGAEARIGLSAASTGLGGIALGRGAGKGVAGRGTAPHGLLRDHLLQGVLLLYFEDVRLLSKVLTNSIIDEPVDTLLFQLRPIFFVVVVISPAEHHQAFRLGLPDVVEVLQQFLGVATDSQDVLALSEAHGHVGGMAADVHHLRVRVCDALGQEQDGVLVLLLTDHGADIRVEGGEDDASFASFLQNAGQDDVEEGVHVEVG